VEVIRRDGITISMSRDKRGKQLQAFLDCLESRRIRIIPRVLQRAIGEVLLSRGVAASFMNFVADFENDPLLRRWLMPLVEFLSKTTNTSERQRLLQHTVIMHALIDTLDPNHSVT